MVAPKLATAHLKMEKELVPDMSEKIHFLTRLSTRKISLNSVAAKASRLVFWNISKLNKHGERTQTFREKLLNSSELGLLIGSLIINTLF